MFNFFKNKNNKNFNKEDFSIFSNYQKESKTLIYLDNAASSLTPDCVIDSLSEYYKNWKSNADRGSYLSAIKSSEIINETRKSVSDFIGATNLGQVIFTSGSTMSANMLVLTFEKFYLKNKDVKFQNKDEILLSVFAHSSDILPWQEFALRNKLKLKVCNEEDFVNAINEKTLIVSHPISSNVTGEIFDLNDVLQKSNLCGAFTVCDATSSIGHINFSLQHSNNKYIDALYFSSHKMCGPSGVGILYLKKDWIDLFIPAFVGGGMVDEINLNSESIYRKDIKAYEAGSPDTASIYALGVAIKYLEEITLNEIENRVRLITQYTIDELNKLNNNKVQVNLYTQNDVRLNSGIVSFELEVNHQVVHSHDVGEVLARDNVCVRTGHHCAKLFMKEINKSSLTRISLYFYNDKEDVNMLINGLKKVIEIFDK